MLSSLSGKIVRPTSSADDLARQQFQGFNICTQKFCLKNKGGSIFAGFRRKSPLLALEGTNAKSQFSMQQSIFKEIT